MFKRIISIVLLGSTLALAGCGDSTSNQDEKKDKKIIAGTVGISQVADKLDLDLVGVPTTKLPLPDRYKDLSQIGQSMKPDFEKIVSLSPDLVILDNNFKDNLSASVEQYGLNAVYFNTSTYSNYIDSIKELGEVTGKSDKADEFISTLQSSVDKVLEKSKNNAEKVKVAILFGTSESFMLASDASYVGDLVDKIGVDNVTDTLEDSKSAYINFSTEQILKMNPDYILRLSHGDVKEAKKAFDEEFANNPAWQSMEAVKEGRVHDLDFSKFGVSANINVSTAIEELGSIIYGE